MPSASSTVLATCSASALGHLVGGRGGDRTPVERGGRRRRGPLCSGTGRGLGRPGMFGSDGIGNGRPVNWSASVGGVRVVVLELGRAGLERRRADDDLGRLVVVDPHLDVGRQVGRALPGPERAQVLLERERRRSAAGERRGTGCDGTAPSPPPPAGLGARRRAEEELALGDAGLVADLLGATAQEVPVGLAHLRQVAVGHRRGRRCRSR